MGLFGISKEKAFLHTSCELGVYRNERIRNQYVRVAKKLGISVFDDDLNSRFVCGSLLLDLGYEKEFIKLARKNLSFLRELGIKRVVVCCPECYLCLIKDYPTLLPDFDIQVDFFVDLALKKLRKKNFRGLAGFSLTYHDPSSIVHHGLSFIEQPRELLSVLGHDVIDITNSGERVFSCGSSGGLPESNAFLASTVCRRRLEELKSADVDVLATLGVRNYEHLSKYASRYGFRIFEFSDLLSFSLGLPVEPPEVSEGELSPSKYEGAYSDELKVLAYSSDASGLSTVPNKVLLPECVEDVQKFVKSNKIISIRGGGSGLVGGSVVSQNSQEGGVVLNLGRMDKVLEVDDNKEFVIVESGVVLTELNEVLGKIGYEFPIVPMSKDIATIGGMVATNAFGFKSVKQKRMADMVIELCVVDGSGEVRKISRVDAASITGMEGITGVITKIKLKIVPKTPKSLMIYRGSLFKLIELSHKLKLRGDVHSILLFDKHLSKLLGLQGSDGSGKDNYYLFVEFEGDTGEIRGRAYESRMRLLERFYFNLAKEGFVRMEDIKLFLDKIPEFDEYLRVNKIPYFSNLGLGVTFPLFRKGDLGKVNDLLGFVKNRMRGGVFGGFGVGVAKREFLDSTERKLVERVKKRYDPRSKFNRGVLITFENLLKERGEREEFSDFLDSVDAAVKFSEDSDKNGGSE